ADLETPVGSIGTPLDNAVGYACWHVGRLLVERGAAVDVLWQAAALGMLGRLEELLEATPPPTEEDVNGAFWQACHGGQRRAAELPLAAGAEITPSPDFAVTQAGLARVVPPAPRRDLLATWLREHGAKSAAGRPRV